MGYSEMVTALRTLLLDKVPASTYVNAAAITALPDWNVLNAGEAIMLVLAPSGWERDIEEKQAISTFKLTEWEVQVDVAARFQQETETHAALLLAMQAIVDTIDAWPKLNATANCFRVDVLRGDAPDAYFPEDEEGGGWFIWPVFVRITETQEIVPQE